MQDLEQELHLDERPIRVMSFNVWGHWTKKVWRNRAAPDVATIGRYGPDLIGLQECQRVNLRTYRKHLPRYAQVRGPRYGNLLTHHLNAILFDPARLELLESGGFWLSETPDRYSRGWGARVPRSANWALFGTRWGLVLHLNTHLDHESAPARRNGSALIIERVERLIQDLRPGTPAILTGDFNCRPATPAYETFARAGYADTFLAAGNTNDTGADTFHAFEGNAYRDPHPEHGPRRIDWILLKDPSGRLNVASHDILRDGAPPYPSDHYPVLAEISPSAGQHLG